MTKRDLALDIERFKRGEITKQSLWEEGLSIHAIEALAAMADGMPPIFAKLIMDGHSRESVEKTVVDILNKGFDNESH